MQAMDHLAETTAHFTAAMGAAATGISVVTTEGLAGRSGLTVSAISESLHVGDATAQTTKNMANIELLME